ncbi:hypothetical protein [Aureimonas sp. ME7]|uniref:hypothetical protein n=1 Tax=Aureimonas sp. ME7 TaxID=2744252 RepID=UPI0015F99D57|nr:hypothetical protein [Aureimonas sp. ME7]
MDVFAMGVGRPFDRLSDRAASGMSQKSTVTILAEFNGPSAPASPWSGASQTFIVPEGGIYTIYAWGRGGRGRGVRGSGTASGGASGAACKKVVELDRGVQLALKIDASGNATVVGSSVNMSAGAATDQTPGIASGGDINLQGVANSGSNGASAPGFSELPGGTRSQGASSSSGDAASQNAGHPGAGSGGAFAPASSGYTATPGSPGGAQIVLVYAEANG